MEATKSSDPALITELPGPRMPVDRGLASLGLLMQLAGTIGVVACTALALIPAFLPEQSLLADGQSSAMVFFAALASALRGVAHRAAGSALLYGGTGRPLRSVYIYLATAAVHSVAAMVALGVIGLSAAAVAQVGAVLLAWPVALGTLLAFAPVRAVVRGGVPPSEDLGFESTAVLMALFGLIGVLAAGLALAALVGAQGGDLATPVMLLPLGVALALLARAILQLMAGYQGTTGSNYLAANEIASRYYNFGMLSAALVGAAAVVEVFMFGQVPAAMLSGITAIALLMVWPTILRRFYAERNFSVHLAGNNAPNFRRAPDSGLTALGWFLLALAAIELARAVPAALFGVGLLPDFLTLFGGGAAAVASAFAPRSEWWSVIVAGAQLWAALELIRMTDRYRLAATVYGAITLAIASYQHWPLFVSVQSVISDPAVSPIRIANHLGATGHAAFGLIVAAVTIVLANRATTPDAVARLRRGER